MELLTEFLSALLFAVLTGAVPVVASYIIKALNQWVTKVTSEIAIAEKDATNSFELKQAQLAQKYFEKLTTLVEDSVVMVSQTYVDDLKKAGTFDASAQKEAFNRAFNNVEALITKDMENVISESFGDLSVLIETLIEAKIGSSKDAAVPASTDPVAALIHKAVE